MKGFVAGAMLVALVASPSLAQVDGPPRNSAWNIHQHAAKGIARHVPGRRHMRGAHEAYGAVTPFGSPGLGQGPPKQMSADRVAAIHACSTMASQFSEPTWGNMQMNEYRGCMAEHGQME